MEMLIQIKPAALVLGAWLLYLTIYWIPLPAALVALLSPEAARMHALAAGYAAEGSTLIYLSVDPYASFSFWLKSCAYATAFFLTVALCHNRDRLRLLAYVLVLSGLIQAIYGALMHLAGTDVWLFGTPIRHSWQASGGFVNRNHLAGFLEITLAIGIGLLIADLEDTAPRSWRRFMRDFAQVVLSRKAPLRLCLIAMVIALVMTRSRMGNMAFFSSLIVAGVIALALSRRATRGTVVLIVSLIVVDIFIVGAWFGVKETVQRIGQTTVGEVEERGDPSAYAMDLFKDYPVFGSGPGSFYTTFSRYRGEDIGSYYDFAHNDYVQMLTETGVIGLILIGAFALMALWAAILAQVRRQDPLARGMGFAVVMGVISLGVHSAVDFNLQIPANAFVFMILLAFGWLSLYLGRSRPDSQA